MQAISLQYNNIQRDRTTNNNPFVPFVGATAEHRFHVAIAVDWAKPSAGGGSTVDATAENQSGGTVTERGGAIHQPNNHDHDTHSTQTETGNGAKSGAKGGGTATGVARTIPAESDCRCATGPFVCRQWHSGLEFEFTQAAYEPALFQHQLLQGDTGSANDETNQAEPVARQMIIPVAQPLFPSSILSVVPTIVELLDDPQVDKNGVTGERRG